MDNKRLLDTIRESKKYKDLFQDTVNNLIIAKPHSEDTLKSKLHQIWGAYYTSRPNFRKILRKIKDGNLDVNTLVKIHSSTKEREVDNQNIFDYIFAIVGNNNSILDIGCGFNPLFLLNSKNFNSYKCVDIDIQQQDFFAQLFSHLNIKKMIAEAGDALLTEFEYSDVVFAFKLLPVLDQIDSTQTDRFLQNLKCRYLVITFPNKSLGGKEKGMVDNYKEQYLKRIGDLGYQFLEAESFKSETVYIFKSKTGQQIARLNFRT